MSDDELIIELDPIEDTVSSPYVPLITPTNTELVSSDSTFWLFSEENRSLLIHAVSDVILFYMFFRYMSEQFSITLLAIQDTEEQIKLFRRQYGIEKQKKRRERLT